MPHLAAVAATVWARRAVVLQYRRWRAPEEIERRVEPYGLVLKAGRWYLVAGGPSGIRTYRVDQILEIRPLEEEFVIPDGFDLAGYWNGYLADFRARLHTAEALVRLTPEGAHRLGVTPTGTGWTPACPSSRSTTPTESSCGWAPMSRSWHRPNYATASPRRHET